MRTYVLLATVSLSMPACKRHVETNGASTDAASASAAVSATPLPEIKLATQPAGGVTGRSVAGVGVVPDWSRGAGSKAKCDAPAGTDAKMKALSKGDDEAIAAGTTDVDALARELTGGCAITRRHLADALNNGGFVHYQKKAYDKANRFWRAALVVRPPHALARFNLACGLALTAKQDDALWMLEQLARAATDGDVSSANLLDKAKSDADLKSLRENARFTKAVAAAAQGVGLVGPRKEPELASAAVKLLPEEYRKTKDRLGVSADGLVTYKPTILDVWTWRPKADVELIVGKLIDDPAKAGLPKGDMNQDYGGLVVVRRGAGGTPELLLARKTGESPPAIAAGKGGAVAYSFSEPCGELRGTLSWTDGKVVVKEQTCEEL